VVGWGGGAPPAPGPALPFGSALATPRPPRATHARTPPPPAAGWCQRRHGQRHLSMPVAAPPAVVPRGGSTPPSRPATRGGRRPGLGTPTRTGVCALHLSGARRARLGEKNSEEGREGGGRWPVGRAHHRWTSPNGASVAVQAAFRGSSGRGDAHGEACGAADFPGQTNTRRKRRLKAGSARPRWNLHALALHFLCVFIFFNYNMADSGRGAWRRGDPACCLVARWSQSRGGHGPPQTWPE